MTYLYLGQGWSRQTPENDTGWGKQACVRKENSEEGHSPELKAWLARQQQRGGGPTAGSGLAYRSGRTWATARSSRAGAAGTCPAWWRAAPPRCCSPSPRPATLRLGSSPGKRSRMETGDKDGGYRGRTSFNRGARHCFLWGYYLNDEGHQDNVKYAGRNQRQTCNPK